MNKIRYDLPSAGAEFRYVSLVLFQMIDSGSLNLEALDISFHIFVETGYISGIGRAERNTGLQVPGRIQEFCACFRQPVQLRVNVYRFVSLCTDLC